MQRTRPSSAHSGLRGPPLSLCDIMQRGYLQQVRMLVQLGASIEVRDTTGRTPLMLTAYVLPEGWGVGVARLLIERGVNMAARDHEGMNALHHACLYEKVELATVLLNALDFDIAQSDKRGNTALHYAASAGNPALVRLLLSYLTRYQKPLDTRNKQGLTPFDEAVRAGSEEVASLIHAALNKNNDNKDDDQRMCESPSFTSREFQNSHRVASAVCSASSLPETRNLWYVFNRKDEVLSSTPKKDDRLLSVQVETTQQKENVPPGGDIQYSGIGRPHTAVIRRRPTSNRHEKASLVTTGPSRTNSFISLCNISAKPAAKKDYNNVNLSNSQRHSTSSHLDSSGRRPGQKPWRATPMRNVSGGRSLLAYDRHPEQVIHVASANDFRNTPEYVLKLTRMNDVTADSGAETLPTLTRRQQSLQYADHANKQNPEIGTWRDEIRLLYHHYEMQCSPSWRNAARQPPDARSLSPTFGQTSLAPGDDMEDASSTKDRKIRRSNSANRQSAAGDASTSSLSVKRRPSPSAHKQRKISSNLPPANTNRTSCSSPDSAKLLTDPATDATLASSFETAPSSSSIKKKESLCVKADASGGERNVLGGSSSNSSTGRKTSKHSFSANGNGGSGSDNSGGAGRDVGDDSSGGDGTLAGSSSGVGPARSRRVGTCERDVPTLMAGALSVGGS